MDYLHRFAQHTVTLLKTLTPSSSNWTVLVRVLLRPRPRCNVGDGDEGRTMSIMLIDSSETMRAVIFGADVNRFESVFQQRKVYHIGNAKLQAVNKKYTRGQYEMCFTRDTLVEIAYDDGSIPDVVFNFLDVGELEKLEDNAEVDFIGIIITISAATTFTARGGKKHTKADIDLLDTMSRPIVLTVWEEEAINFRHSYRPGDVIGLKCGRMKLFRRTPTLSAVTSSIILSNFPRHLRETQTLKFIFEQKHGNTNMATLGPESRIAKSGIRLMGEKWESHNVSLENWGTLAQMKRILLEKRKKPGLSKAFRDVGYLTNMFYITGVRGRSLLQISCPYDDCKKTISSQTDKSGSCTKCSRSVGNWIPRLRASLTISDSTDSSSLLLKDDPCSVDVIKSLGGDISTIVGDISVVGSEVEKRLAEQLCFSRHIVRLKIKLIDDNKVTLIAPNKNGSLKSAPVVITRAK